MATSIIFLILLLAGLFAVKLALGIISLAVKVFVIGAVVLGLVGVGKLVLGSRSK